MFQTSVNCGIQFRKRLVSPPVTGYPQHLYPCLSWGSLQPPQDLLLYLVLQVLARNSTLPIHLFHHWVPMQDDFSVQKAVSFKISFKFTFPCCTNPLAHLFSAKTFSMFPFSAPVKEQRKLQRMAILLFCFLQHFHSTPLWHFTFFKLSIFCLVFILLPTWGIYGTTNSSEFCFLSGVPEHINLSSSFWWTLIILHM